MKALKFLKLSFTFLMLAICINYMGCTSSLYTCEIIDSSQENDFFNNNTDKLSSVEINGKIYNLVYKKSRLSELTNEKIDHYSITAGTGLEESSEPLISIDSEHNDILFYLGITPYPAIDEIEKLSDEELKNAVEELMSDEIDFAKYNDFSAFYPGSIRNCILTWQVKYDYTLNVKLIVYINSEGLIYCVQKIDSCREGVVAPFLSNDERDTLISKKLHEKLKIDANEIINFTIESELLTLNRGKDAVDYTVKATTEDGFYDLYVIQIFKNK
ncbi:MAG: hypothetical protein A2Y17_04045 [Clostridiales bacterium GWF2_38_85]|nr:MAG: hypothetical protein A2Y17_04045 [Clostridiales bacterium GWF2_38_85]HBL83475.1 hypothetical protein [Clostridiales bacterium]